MPLLRREAAAHDADTSVHAESPDLSGLRHEVDPDPVVEEATERLRDTLASLDARDEWGRALAWRQVARIAVGPLAAQLRDAQTAATLSSAADTPIPAPAAAPATIEPELFATQRSGDDTGLPFGTA